MRIHQKGFSPLWLVIGAGLLVVTSAVTYIGYSNFVAKVTPEPTSTGTTYVPPQNIDGKLYVAMGDSFSSGQGADRNPGYKTIDFSLYDPATTTASNMCFRSRVNAANLLARDIGYTMTDVSCSAASASLALTKGQWNEPPQINAINSDTSLVTMTFGGNDAALTNVITGCIMTKECKVSDSQVKTAQTKIPIMTTTVDQILTAVTQKAKNVKVRWAGYPLAMAAPGSPVGACNFLSKNEQVMWRDLLTSANLAVKQGVDTFNARHAGSDVNFDVKYVDPLAPDSPFMLTDNGLTRDACSSNPKRGINGPLDIDVGWWHPNINGHQYYYELYKASL